MGPPVLARRNKTNVKSRVVAGGRRAGAAAAVAGRRSYATAMTRYNPRYGAAPQISRPSGELKGCDVNVTLIIAGNLPQVTNTNTGVAVLNCVAPGNGSFNRIGKRIFLKSVRVRGNFEVLPDNNGAPSTTSTRGALVRMVVVWDANPNSGNIPTFDTIFGHTNQDGTEYCTIADGLRYDNVGRFKVLRDQVWCVNPVIAPPATDAGVIVRTAFDEFIKLDGLQTVFSGQSAACSINDISSGALYVYFRQNFDANTTAGLGDCTARLRYTD